MSILSKLKQFVQKNVKTIGVTAAVALAIGGGAATLGKVSAVTPVSVPDKNANAVIWGGASTPAELDTIYHKNGGDGHNTSASIQTIYAHFGIDSSDIDAMSSDSVTGYVTSTGDVYAGTTLVATNALTAGRQWLPHSSPQDCGVNGTQTYYDPNGVPGDAFYTRTPSVSFCNPALTAMVVMKNGVFQFAILVSCGNPVTATPVPPKPKPALTCSQLNDTPGTIESDGDQNYSFEAVANPTGGATVSSYEFNFDDGTTKTVNTSSNSTSVSHLFSPGTWKITVTINGSNSLQASCTKTITVNKPTPPTPKPGSLVCSSLNLTAAAVSGDGSQEFTLEAQAAPSAQNATITGYTFNLGKGFGTLPVSTSASKTSVTYKYPAGTNVTASVTVTGIVNGKTYTTTVAPGSPCSKQVQVSTPEASSIVCEDLAYSAGTANSQGYIPYTLTADAIPTNATITGYTFSLAPNVSQPTDSYTTSPYAPGANVSVSVTVNGTLANGNKVNVTSQNCAISFTVPTTPTCTSLSGQTYAAGSTQCQTCTSPSGQTYQEGSSQCTTPTTTTTSTTPLPNTGPGDVVGLFSGVSMSGAGLHRILGNRRARRTASRSR